MSRSAHTEAQIIGAVKQVEAGHRRPAVPRGLVNSSPNGLHTPPESTRHFVASNILCLPTFHR